MSGEEAKKDEVVEAAAPTDAEAAAPKEVKEETKELKRVNKPDETAMKEKISVVEEKISKLTERLSSIKEQLDKNDSSRPDANSELGKAKAQFNNAKSESRRLQQEKRNIYDQISAADELRQQQQDLVTRLRGELQVFSVDEIERKIKQLEYKQSTTSLTVKEDKAIMEEIKKLSSGKPKIQSFKEAQDSLTGIREHHNTLYVSLKAKSNELTAAKEAEEKVKGTFDELRAKEDAKRPDMPKLFKERDELRKQMTEHRDALRKIQAEFNDERKAWFAFQKEDRDRKQKEYLEHKAAKQAEWDAWKKLQEEEEAKRDPWEDEKALCMQLIAWVEKQMPKKEEAVAEVKIEHLDGKKPYSKADLDSEDPFAGLGAKKGKKKGKKGVPTAEILPTAGKSVKLKQTFEDLALWSKLDIEAPKEMSDMPIVMQALLDKQEWFKTAPPKPKKEKKEKEDKKEKKGDKGEEAPAFDEAADAAKKRVAEDKKAAEKLAAEDAAVKKAQELEASGKKVSGGLHKFDAAEVDINGGAATADDFIDAFGF